MLRRLIPINGRYKCARHCVWISQEPAIANGDRNLADDLRQYLRMRPVRTTYLDETPLAKDVVVPLSARSFVISLFAGKGIGIAMAKLWVGFWGTTMSAFDAVDGSSIPCQLAPIALGVMVLSAVGYPR